MANTTTQDLSYRFCLILLLARDPKNRIYSHVLCPADIGGDTPFFPFFFVYLKNTNYLCNWYLNNVIKKEAYE